jgi:hypothetical protein
VMDIFTSHFVVLLFSSLWSAGVALSLSFFSAGYAYAI